MARANDHSRRALRSRERSLALPISGALGLDLGMQRAGFKACAAVECTLPRDSHRPHQPPECATDAPTDERAHSDPKAGQCPA